MVEESFVFNPQTVSALVSRLQQKQGRPLEIQGDGTVAAPTDTDAGQHYCVCGRKAAEGYRCSGCHYLYYCSKECQAKHWNDPDYPHRKDCKNLPGRIAVLNQLLVQVRCPATPLWQNIVEEAKKHRCGRLLVSLNIDKIVDTVEPTPQLSWQDEDQPDFPVDKSFLLEVYVFNGGTEEHDNLRGAASTFTTALPFDRNHAMYLDAFYFPQPRVLPKNREERALFVRAVKEKILEIMQIKEPSALNSMEDEEKADKQLESGTVSHLAEFVEGTHEMALLVEAKHERRIYFFRCACATQSGQ